MGKWEKRSTAALIVFEGWNGMDVQHIVWWSPQPLQNSGMQDLCSYWEVLASASHLGNAFSVSDSHLFHFLICFLLNCPVCTGNQLRSKRGSKGEYIGRILLIHPVSSCVVTFLFLAKVMSMHVTHHCMNTIYIYILLSY